MAAGRGDLGALGSRLLFLTVSTKVSQEERICYAYDNVFGSSRKPYRDRINSCRVAIREYMARLRAHYCNDDFARSFKWDRQNNDPQLMNMISLISDVASRCRSQVAVWEPKGKSSGSGHEFSQPLIEYPERLMTILYSLARGHALLSGNKTLSVEDLSLVIAVALSSMPNDRRQVLDLVLEIKSDEKVSECGEITPGEIERILNVSRPTALKLMKELSLLGVTNIEESVGNEPSRITLKTVYNWLLSDQFQGLRRTWEKMLDRSRSLVPCLKENPPVKNNRFDSRGNYSP